MANNKKRAKKKGIYPPIKKTQEDTIQGIIRLNPRGFGFVQPDSHSPFDEDIFIPRHATKNAVDGDRVEVSLSLAQLSDKGPEGKVVAILSRSRTHIAGIITSVDFDSAEVYVPLLGVDHGVILEIVSPEDVSIGDRVVMEVIEWGQERKRTRCSLSHKIGHILDPSVDIPAAIEEFEIRRDFPLKALEEAAAYGKSVPANEIKKRLDLREVETYTIDPDTALDYDDALSLSKDPHGVYHLWVHIADVSHYVKVGSMLDQEAFIRANSTYFPNQCVPMLPSVLSDNLCSLKPHVNRLTISVLMDFDQQGEMIHYEIHRSIIKSAKRFTYKEAKKVLEGKIKSPHAKTLHLMAECCALLKKKRYERGSVEFAMPELVIKIDPEGKPTGTEYIEYDVTHQLVEEFMLKANETVAKHLDAKGHGVPFRVHDEPSEENMRDFSLLASAFGFKLPTQPSPSDIQKMFDEALKTPYGQYLATSYIRRMRLAVYSPTNIGHFGLALTHYCHFTSPIRRYVDLVAHRLLFEPPADIKALEVIAKRCSEQERISAKAEGSVTTLKKYRLLNAYFKEHPKRQYEAVITRVKPFGFFFEVLEVMVEGFIHVSEIGTDYYEFEEKGNILRGNRRGEFFVAGNNIFVMIKELNLITCEGSWHLANAKKERKK